ncbi:MAG: aminotransferase class I/II-fold pyridoxal phosphate-dependent enzyme [Phycisphaeraceae bacterium]|nr:aminotransferase class I/II-fold pyridoxal phosphate-dependent enzyme [Phycisphaeraceae bacterium]
MTYERPNIQRAAGYVPGEQPEADNLVKLNTNENPYPPCPAVMAVLRDFPPERLRRYPSPTAAKFRDVAARVHGLTPDHIIPTNGGDELLRLVITTFVEPGAPIGMAEPSYSLYPVLAEIHNSPMVRIALRDDWSLPADFARKLNDARAQLAFVVNPHAPSGTLTSVADLDRLAAEFRGVLVIDEAYVDFVAPKCNYNSLDLLRTRPNVLLLRTMSKGYSLAGLRFAYGLASPSLIEPILTKTKDSYNTDAISQALATAALENRPAAAQTWQAVIAERTRLTAELARRGYTVPPSQSNFILAQPPAAATSPSPPAQPPAQPGGTSSSPTPPKTPSAREIYESLKQKQVFVRYFDQDRLRDKMRITIGTPGENNALLAGLDQLSAS